MNAASAAWIGRLVEGAAEFGVPLDAEAVGRFETYLALLLRWNSRIKLTSVVEPLAVVEKHFLDSIAVAPLLIDVKTLVDVGSGPGFPGVPLAMLRPAMEVTLVESIQKKAAFLEALRRELRLPNVRVEAVRMEGVIGAGRQFDAAVSRATFAPGEWVRDGAALVRPGGRLVAMVVPEAAEGEGNALAFAAGWEGNWQAAAVRAPYAPGRALALFSGRRE